MRRRTFLKVLAKAGALMSPALLRSLAFSTPSPSRPNFLIITADDMDHGSLGIMGSSVDSITPNLDGLASEGLLITNAHVACSACQPSRQAMLTGLYPHNYGSEGFRPVPPETPTLIERLRAEGYYTAIFGKEGHHAPPEKFPWTRVFAAEGLARGRSPGKIGAAVEEALLEADGQSRPFFLLVNSHDPHRPFAGSRGEGQLFRRSDEMAPAPSRMYAEDEVQIPPSLPDLPEIRRDLAAYFSSVRRFDDTAGKVLDALERSGRSQNTVVMMLSDNGLAVPFGKSSLYRAGTQTPLIVRWPGVVDAGREDRESVINALDLTPTVLEILESPAFARQDGASLLPLLRGEDSARRDTTFTQYHENIRRERFPSRAVHSSRFTYIFNAWSDGQRRFQTSYDKRTTSLAMHRWAKTDPAVANRFEFWLTRAPEELYDYDRDPGAVENLADRRDHAPQLERLRDLMREEMIRIDDPLLSEFDEFLASR